MMCWHRIRKRKKVRNKEEFYLVLSRSEAKKIIERINDLRANEQNGILIDVKLTLKNKLLSVR